MADIVLTTLNARYAHSSFGLRYLLANLGDLQKCAKLIEFDISQRPIDMLEPILAENPKIVGIGVYIWNANESLQLVSQLKRVAPQVTVVLGGPEVSYETNQQEICALADYVITGEADLAFAGLCEQLLSGRRPLMKVIPAEFPEFAPKATPSPWKGDGGGEGRPRHVEDASFAQQTASTAALDPHPNPLPFRERGPERRALALPYRFYTERDIEHRVIYVEASRGCPFKCEFCLSSLDVPVRNVPIDLFLAEMQSLLDRGVRQFKFVDRTFNLNLNISKSILQFFLDRYTPDLFLHFEMIPDRLPEALRELIKQFPPGALQFEVGVQTFNEDVSQRISRRQDNTKLSENFRFLRDETGVHIHADLIVGLPGEDLASFGRGFDRLVALRPQEIQVGMLKRLRGTPIVRHDVDWGMVYSPHAPYEILQTKLIDFATMQRLRRFSRYWDLIANSGNFVETTPTIWGDQSPFEQFMRFSDWLFADTGQTHAISLSRLSELIFNFLTRELAQDPQAVAQVIWRDFQRIGRSDRPAFLKDYVEPADTRVVRSGRAIVPSRQVRHLG
jgi:radical SAM superfamily enzyme YgiQ (UPF0313 family)